MDLVCVVFMYIQQLVVSSLGNEETSRRLEKKGMGGPRGRQSVLESYESSERKLRLHTHTFIYTHNTYIKKALKMQSQRRREKVPTLLLLYNPPIVKVIKLAFPDQDDKIPSFSLLIFTEANSHSEKNKRDDINLERESCPICANVRLCRRIGWSELIVEQTARLVQHALSTKRQSPFFLVFSFPCLQLTLPTLLEQKLNYSLRI